MPFKIFTPNQLTAAEVNTYLMQQAVMVFASAAARSTALTTPVEGMVTYLQDVDKLQYWNGTLWVSVGAGGISTVTMLEIGP